MVVNRKPHQIFLIEHIFYPIIAFIFLVLSLGYGGKVLTKTTSFSPEQIGMIMGLGSMAVIFIGASVLIPFSCARLWVSANKNLTGPLRNFSKSYAAILFAFLVSYGLLTIFQLPTVIKESIKIAIPK